MDKQKGFLMAALALALMATLESEEKPKSARSNRCNAAQDAIIRVCDMYVPDGINTVDINKLWEILDGPVMEVLRSNADSILAIGASHGEHA